MKKQCEIVVNGVKVRGEAKSLLTLIAEMSKQQEKQEAKIAAQKPVDAETAQAVKAIYLGKYGKRFTTKEGKQFAVPFTIFKGIASGIRAEKRGKAFELFGGDAFHKEIEEVRQKYPEAFVK